MHDFAVRTPEQLPGLLKSLRKASGLTQAEVAARLGISQQTLSAMERRATTVGAARLMGLLNVLGVELVLRVCRISRIHTVRPAPGSCRSRVRPSVPNARHGHHPCGLLKPSRWAREKRCRYRAHAEPLAVPQSIRTRLCRLGACTNPDP